MGKTNRSPQFNNGSKLHANCQYGGTSNSSPLLRIFHNNGHNIIGLTVDCACFQLIPGRNHFSCWTHKRKRFQLDGNTSILIVHQLLQYSRGVASSSTSYDGSKKCICCCCSSYFCAGTSCLSPLSPPSFYSQYSIYFVHWRIMQLFTISRRGHCSITHQQLFHIRDAFE